jgi:hypothetical protein
MKGHIGKKTLLLVFACTGSGTALSADVCVDFCVAQALDAESTCQDMSCVAETDLLLEDCLLSCPVTVDIPQETWLLDFADTQATERFGVVERIDQQLYHLPTGEPGGWMAIYRSKGTTHTRDSLVDALAIDPHLSLASEVFGVHVGAHESQPPLLAAWSGAPEEYFAVTDGSAALKSVFDVSKATLEGRFGDPLGLYFSFSAGGETYFYAPVHGGVTREVVPKAEKTSYDTLMRLEGIKHQWKQLLEDTSKP